MRIKIPAAQAPGGSFDYCHQTIYFISIHKLYNTQESAFCLFILCTQTPNCVVKRPNVFGETRRLLRQTFLLGQLLCAKFWLWITYGKAKWLSWTGAICAERTVMLWITFYCIEVARSLWDNVFRRLELA